jgi:hypothetical protein
MDSRIAINEDSYKLERLQEEGTNNARPLPSENQSAT